MLRGRCPEQIAHQALHGARAKLAVGQLLGQAIDTLQPLRRCLGLVDVDLGVNNVIAILVERRLAEKQVLDPRAVGLHETLDTVEPNDLDGARAVGKEGLQSALAPLASRGECHKSSPQLDVGHLAVNLADVVNGAAVDIAEREIIDQVVECGYAQFLAQQLSSFGSHSRQILDVHPSQVASHA